VDTITRTRLFSRTGTGIVLVAIGRKNDRRYPWWTDGAVFFQPSEAAGGFGVLSPVNKIRGITHPQRL
jgi:hypothetical protein